MPIYSKTCVIGHSQKDKTNYRLMQVKSIAECSKGEHSAKLLTFTKLPFVIKIFVWSIFEWPFYTGFTTFLILNLKVAMKFSCKQTLVVSNEKSHRHQRDPIYIKKKIYQRALTLLKKITQQLHAVDMHIFS